VTSGEVRVSRGALPSGCSLGPLRFPDGAGRNWAGRAHTVAGACPVDSRPCARSRYVVLAACIRAGMTSKTSPTTA